MVLVVAFLTEVGFLGQAEVGSLQILAFLTDRLLELLLMDVGEGKLY